MKTDIKVKYGSWRELLNNSTENRKQYWWWRDLIGQIMRMK